MSDMDTTYTVVMVFMGRGGKKTTRKATGLTWEKKEAWKDDLVSHNPALLSFSSFPEGRAA